jgi:hypothetical protein
MAGFLRFDVRAGRQPAPLRHLRSNFRDLPRPQHLRRQRKQLIVLDPQVTPVERDERVPQLAQSAGIRAAEDAVIEPAASEAIDLVVRVVSLAVIGLESVDFVHRRRDARIIGGAEARKQGLFLISSVSRRGGAKIFQRRLDGLALGVRQRVGGCYIADPEKDTEEMLDSAMAIAEQSDGLIKIVSGSGTQCDGHGEPR